MNTFGIYKILNKINGKVYIGSTAKSFYHRWHVHKSNLKKNTHHCTYLQNAWNKYGEENFEFHIIKEFSVEDFPNISYKELNIKILEIEQSYLDEYKNKYNILSKAGSSLGSKHTEESKLKMSLLKKGKPLHPNTVKARINAITGKKRPYAKRTKRS